MNRIPALVTISCAGFASANPFFQTEGLATWSADLAGVPTASLLIDISGFESIEMQGSDLNQSLSVFIGVGAVITGISWDVTLTTFGESWASESAISFEGQFILKPGIGDSFGVTNANYNSGGMVDLTNAGLTNITAGADGYLDIEFFESFVDMPGEPDAQWQSGSRITIFGYTVPAPGALPVLAAMAVVVTKRRRDG